MEKKTEGIPIVYIWETTRPSITEEEKTPATDPLPQSGTQHDRTCSARDAMFFLLFSPLFALHIAPLFYLVFEDDQFSDSGVKQDDVARVDALINTQNW